MNVTIRDIASAARVSPATVSLVLNDRQGVGEPTRHRVLRKAQELNYKPRPSGRPRRRQVTKTIAVLYSQRAVRGNGLTSLARDWIRAIKETVAETGQHLAIFGESGDADSDLVFQDELNSGELGAVVTIGVACTDRYIELLLERNIPIVALSHPARFGQFSSVRSDDFNGGRQAMERLLAEGHRRVAVINTQTDLEFAAARRAGALSVIAREGAHCVADLAVSEALEEQEVREACDQLLDSGATGVFIAGDLLAASCYDRLTALGVAVPRDLAIIGYGNLPEGLGPQRRKLTTVGFDRLRIGRIAAEMACEFAQANGPFETRSVRVPTFIIEGDTLAPPRSPDDKQP